MNRLARNQLATPQDPDVTRAICGRLLRLHGVDPDVPKQRRLPALVLPDRAFRNGVCSEHHGRGSGRAADLSAEPHLRPVNSRPKKFLRRAGRTGSSEEAKWIILHAADRTPDE